MKLQKLKQNTVCFVIAYFLHIALVILAIVVMENFKSIGIAQVYPIRKMLTITTLVTIF